MNQPLFLDFTSVSTDRIVKNQSWLCSFSFQPKISDQDFVHPQTHEPLLFLNHLISEPHSVLKTPPLSFCFQSNKNISWSTGISPFVACVAWRFWLLSNKGGRGQKNREEIGAGATGFYFFSRASRANFAGARLDKTTILTKPPCYAGYSFRYTRLRDRFIFCPERNSNFIQS